MFIRLKFLKSFLLENFVYFCVQVKWFGTHLEYDKIK